MFAPLPEERAKKYCLELLDFLKHEVNPPDMHLVNELAPVYPQASPVWIKGKYREKLFGVLVCTDSSGREVVLKAFSGKLSGQWYVPGWVPPLFDTEKYDTALSINDEKCHELSRMIAGAKNVIELSELKKERLKLEEDARKNAGRLYMFHCLDGSVKSFDDLQVLPPPGAGDCCAPKLLDFAIRSGLQPVSMAQFFYDDSVKNTLRTPGEFYPPCDDKCALILPAMLGLHIIYRDTDCAVISKPADVSCDTVVAALRRLFPSCTAHPAAYSLETDVSGLMILALSGAAEKAVAEQYRKGEIEETLTGLLDGRLAADMKQGCLPLAETCVSQWKKQKLIHSRYQGLRTYTSIEFRQPCGHSEQLRAAAAGPGGFGFPFVGDKKYGTRDKDQYLLLHVSGLSCKHPVTGKQLSFSSIPPFYVSGRNAVIL